MKRIIVWALCLTAGAWLHAAPLTPTQALNRATATASAKLQKHIAMNRPRLVHTVNIASTDAPACYIFNSPTGFVVLGADDVAMPVLGYGDGAQFDPDNIPTNMQAWLAGYASEIAYATENGVAAADGGGASRTDLTPIAPLMKTQWGQHEPYNLLCPKVDGNRVPCGCVATALAQVAYYHKWPRTHGVGEYSYNWGDRTLVFDYENNTFDWGSMLTEYGYDRNNTNMADPANSSVATLVYAIAVGADMQFAPGGSGASISGALTNMAEHMGYNINAYVCSRSSHTLADFEALVHGQLAKKHPVPLSGANVSADGNRAGHAFVTDGYGGGGFFHINWGWSGMSDGYFRLSALDPDQQGAGGSADGYSFGLDAYFDVYPSNAEFDQPHMGCDEIVAEKMLVALDESTTITLKSVGNRSVVTLTDIVMGLKFDNGTESEYMPMVYAGDLPAGYYYTEVPMPLTLPKDFPEGTYTLTPAFYINEDENWCDMETPVYGKNMLTLKVRGALATFVSPAMGRAEVTSIEFAASPLAGGKYEVEVVIENTSKTKVVETTVFGGVVYDGSDEVTSVGNLLTVHLEPGEKQTIVYGGTMPEQAGKCTFNIYEGTSTENCKPLGAGVALTLENAKPAVLSLLSTYKLTATVPEGETTGTVTFDGDVYTESGHSCYYTVLSGGTFTQNNYGGDYFMYTAGSNTHVNISMPFENVAVGERVAVMLIYLDEDNAWKELLSYAETSFVQAAGIDDVVSDAKEVQNRVYYTLQGVAVGNDLSALARGIYIEVSKYADGTAKTCRRLVK